MEIKWLSVPFFIDDSEAQLPHFDGMWSPGVEDSIGDSTIRDYLQSECYDYLYLVIRIHDYKIQVYMYSAYEQVTFALIFILVTHVMRI